MANETAQAEALEILVKQVKDAKCYAYNSTLETLYGLDPSYGYYPSEAAGIVFDVLFFLATSYHIVQYSRFRSATSILLGIGAFTELIGWGARTYSSFCVYNSDAFLAQEVTLIIAPLFFSAALYVILGKLIIDLGRSSSLLSSKWYTILFCTCDLISLVVQAVGGAKASTADTLNEQDQGTYIMVAGIAFQLLTMTIFGVLLLDFARRVMRGLRDSVTKGMKMVFLALIVSFVMIYIRSVYRTVELSQGWNGYLISHESYFIGLDAAIMVVAVGVFIGFLDPAIVFPRHGKGIVAASDGARSKNLSYASNDDMETGTSFQG